MTGLNGRGHQLNARAETELGEDVRDVALHGPPGQEQLRGDVRARSTGGHQDGDLALGLGQRAPADARPLWRPAAAQPSLPQPAGGPVDVPDGVQAFIPIQSGIERGARFGRPPLLDQDGRGQLVRVPLVQRPAGLLEGVCRHEEQPGVPVGGALAEGGRTPDVRRGVDLGELVQRGRHPAGLVRGAQGDREAGDVRAQVVQLDRLGQRLNALLPVLHQGPQGALGLAITLPGQRLGQQAQEVPVLSRQAVVGLAHQPGVDLGQRIVPPAVQVPDPDQAHVVPSQERAPATFALSQPGLERRFGIGQAIQLQQAEAADDVRGYLQVGLDLQRAERGQGPVRQLYPLLVALLHQAYPGLDVQPVRGAVGVGAGSHRRAPSDAGSGWAASAARAARSASTGRPAHSKARASLSRGRSPCIRCWSSARSSRSTARPGARTISGSATRASQSTASASRLPPASRYWATRSTGAPADTSAFAARTCNERRTSTGRSSANAWRISSCRKTSSSSASASRPALSASFTTSQSVMTEVPSTVDSSVMVKPGARTAPTRSTSRASLDRKASRRRIASTSDSGTLRPSTRVAVPATIRSRPSRVSASTSSVMYSGFPPAPATRSSRPGPGGAPASCSTSAATAGGSNGPRVSGTAPRASRPRISVSNSSPRGIGRYAATTSRGSWSIARPRRLSTTRLDGSAHCRSSMIRTTEPAVHHRSTRSRIASVTMNS